MFANLLRAIGVAEDGLEQRKHLGFENQILQLVTEALRDSILELGQELDQLVIVGQLAQRSGEILDPLAVDPGSNFGLNGPGNSGDGLGGGSASEEAGEAMAPGLLQGVNQVFEAG